MARPRKLPTDRMLAILKVLDPITPQRTYQIVHQAEEITHSTAYQRLINMQSKGWVEKTIINNFGKGVTGWKLTPAGVDLLEQQEEENS